MEIEKKVTYFFHDSNYTTTDGWGGGDKHEEDT